MATTTPRQVVYDIASGYKTATGDTTEINYGNVVTKVLSAIGSGGVAITDITLNADGTYTVTDANADTHTLAVTETDGQITAITYDENSVPLSFTSGLLTGVGDTDVDVSRYVGVGGIQPIKEIALTSDTSSDLYIEFTNEELQNIDVLLIVIDVKFSQNDWLYFTEDLSNKTSHYFGNSSSGYSAINFTYCLKKDNGVYKPCFQIQPDRIPVQGGYSSYNISSTNRLYFTKWYGATSFSAGTTIKIYDGTGWFFNE